MGYFGGLVTDLGGRVKEVDTATDSGKTVAKRYINRAARWIYSSHHWEWRYKTGSITLIPNYTTGTCSVVSYTGSNESDARTVTFSGSTLTSAMQGRYIKVSGEDDWHKIVYVEATNNQIVLETPILRATAGGLSFEIWKRFYYLPGDVSAIMDFGRWASRWGRLEYKSLSNLADQVADISTDGTPESFSPFGIDNYEPSYSVGSISGAKDGNLITGSGSSWLGNVLPGDEIFANESDVIFTVKRVESNQRIVLNNYLAEIVPASSLYTARRNLSVGFQFYPNQMDDYQTIPFTYYDKMFDMVHETKDRPNLPDEFDDVILTRAEFKLKKDKGDSSWPIISQLYSAELEGLKKDFRFARPRFDQFSPTTTGYPGR